MNDWKKKFAIIWSGQIFSILSSAIVQFAIVLWISLETKSAEVLAIATIAALLPQTLLGPVAGVYVDRWNRKWTIIGADSFVALCSAILALLFYLNMAEVWYVYLALALRSIGSAFHSPAMQSSVPLLAPEKELTRIAAVNQTLQSICNIGGPALGAILIMSFNMSFVIMLDVIGALIACIALLFVHIPNPEKEKEEKAAGVIQEMKEGFFAIRNNHKFMWVMLVEVLVTFFVMPIVALFPLMTLVHFNGNAYQVSLIEVVYGSGMFLGGILLGIRPPKIKKIILINGTYIIMGLCLAICGLLPANGFLYFAILNAIIGLSMPYYSSPFVALMQMQFHPSVLGRVYSVSLSASLIPSMIGLLSTGLLADYVGIANVFAIGGTAILIIGISSLFNRSIMTIEDK